MSHRFLEWCNFPPRGEEVQDDFLRSGEGSWRPLSAVIFQAIPPNRHSALRVSCVTGIAESVRKARINKKREREKEISDLKMLKVWRWREVGNQMIIILCA